jgi:hypothetical protein
VLQSNRREAAVNLKEHLQFVAMMIPTLLLIAALVASVAFPAQSTGADSERPAFSEVVAVAEMSFADDSDGGTASSAAAR